MTSGDCTYTSIQSKKAHTIHTLRVRYMYRQSNSLQELFRHGDDVTVHQ